MIDFRTALQTELKTVHPRVYFQVAPETAEFPYLVYDFPSDIDDGESMELIAVDIDGWDSPADGDTANLENLMTNVNVKVNKNVLTNQGFVILPWQPGEKDIAAVFYLDTKLSLTDDDPRIRRRKYIYQAKLFRKG